MDWSKVCRNTWRALGSNLSIRPSPQTNPCLKARLALPPRRAYNIIQPTQKPTVTAMLVSVLIQHMTRFLVAVVRVLTLIQHILRRLAVVLTSMAPTTGPLAVVSTSMAPTTRQPRLLLDGQVVQHDVRPTVTLCSPSIAMRR